MKTKSANRALEDTSYGDMRGRTLCRGDVFRRFLHDWPQWELYLQYNIQYSGLSYPNEIFHEMDEFDETIQHTIKLLNMAEIDMMDLPPRLRKRTLEIEEEMTVARNRGDLEWFYELIDEWRYIFMCREELKRDGA